MRVRYKINKAIYNTMREIFYETKEKEDDLDLAKIIETENETAYITCLGNKWFVGAWHSDGTTIYYFGYEGSRNGFSLAMPFRDTTTGAPRFFLDYPGSYFTDDKSVRICIRKDYIEKNKSDGEDEDVKQFGEQFIDRCGKTFDYVCYELRRLIEYRTTLPASIVHPLDTIKKLLTDEKAVIMRGDMPLMVIEYKNCYKGLESC